MDHELTFIEPGPHPLTAKLDVPDLAEGGEDLLEVLPVYVPGEAPDVDLGGGRGPAPGPTLGPGLGPGPLSRLFWRSLQRIMYYHVRVSLWILCLVKGHLMLSYAVP